jgi:hypothetical protein
MSIFDTGITDAITKTIESTSKAYADAIIQGFDRAANIIADRLEKIEKDKAMTTTNDKCKCEVCECEVCECD